MSKEIQNPEPDDDYREDYREDDDVQDEPDYYACGCGYTCSPRTYESLFGGECPRCTAKGLEPEYY